MNEIDDIIGYLTGLLEATSPRGRAAPGFAEELKILIPAADVVLSDDEKKVLRKALMKLLKKYKSGPMVIRD